MKRTIILVIFVCFLAAGTVILLSSDQKTAPLAKQLAPEASRQLRPLYDGGPVSLAQAKSKIKNLLGPTKILSVTQPNKDSLMFCQKIVSQINCTLVLMTTQQQVLIITDNLNQALRSAPSNLAILVDQAKKQKIIDQGPQ